MEDGQAFISSYTGVGGALSSAAIHKITRDFGANRETGSQSICGASILTSVGPGDFKTSPHYCMSRRKFGGEAGPV